MQMQKAIMKTWNTNVTDFNTREVNNSDNELKEE